MGTCAVAQSCFGDGDRAQQEMAVAGWLDLEDDPHAIGEEECGAAGSGEEQLNIKEPLGKDTSCSHAPSQKSGQVLGAVPSRLVRQLGCRGVNH